MFKPTADKKGLIELSIKQRDQWLGYQFDKARSPWPQLPENSQERPIRHSRQQTMSPRRPESQ